MRSLLFSLAALAVSLTFSGCLTTTVADSGGPGSVTVPNSNWVSISAAANAAFAQHGYTPTPSSSMDTLAYDKPAGAFGQLMYGSYGQSTTYRVHVQIVQIPGTNDYRLIPRVSRVNNAGSAGFESKTRMMGFWAGQFGPILKQVAEQAGNANG
ncbi:hypothetical protein TSACC_3382 [Terrimicrobium sacchariphilum]|uniref:DUF4136 domain-containing protein n=1 Tax=Terrimicrobium sacchariphilum TaxID=690879 RepID=A0A146GFB7_TERSA|nr:hypothetical protein [Terrimicrobium sacchariphilum]GAT35317.1 hypothetical protein TSACC_3382 [Terrimicrobium sacchariphilum]